MITHVPRAASVILWCAVLGIILLCSCIARAATNSVRFDLGSYGATSVAYKPVRIKPSDSSFPRVEGVTVIGRDYGYKITDASGVFTQSMVSGTYSITFTQQFSPTTFEITVPSTNYSGVLNASELTTSGTNAPGNLAAYSQTAANARFVLKDSGVSTNQQLVATNTPTVGMVPTATTTGGLWKWSSAGSGDVLNSTILNLSNAFALYVNVKDPRFGATGNGSTDDLLAISNAIAYASAGATIFFPTGTYLVSTSINLTKPVNFLGAGLGGESAGGARITGNFGAPIINSVSAGADNGIRVSSLYINNSHAAGTGIKHCGFITAFFDRLHINAFRGLDLQTSTFTTTVIGDRITWASQATNSIGVLAGGHVTIQNCDIVALNKGIVAFAAGNKIIGNRIEVNTFGLVLGEKADGSVSSFGGDVIGNTLENNGISLRGTALQGVIVAGNRIIGTSNATIAASYGVYLDTVNATVFNGNKIGGAFTIAGTANVPGSDINSCMFAATTAENTDVGGVAWGFNHPSGACISYVSCNNPEGDKFCRSGGTNDLFSVWLDGARKFQIRSNGVAYDGNGSLYVTNSTGIDAGGGTGEANTAANLGGGLNTYDSKSGVSLRFNTFSNAGDGISVSSNANLFTISADSSIARVADETTRNAAVSNAVVAEIMTASNTLYTTETTRNAAVSNAVITYTDGKVSDTAFASSWNGVTTIAPSKNAVWDYVALLQHSGSSQSLSNLSANPIPFTNILVAGWGQVLTTNAGVVTATLTNRAATIPTNAASATVDFSDTANVNEYNTWFHLSADLNIAPTNLVVGRTLKIYFATNSLTYNVTVTNTAGTIVKWNFNVATNGATSVTKTNSLAARLFLTAETNGVLTADFGYYR